MPYNPSDWYGGDSGGGGSPWGGGSNPFGGQSSNQNFAVLPPAPTVTPGVVPPATGYNPQNPAGLDTWSHTGWTERPQSTGFTENFITWLNSQMGQGATPFNLSSTQPSTGGASSPGQLTAGLTPLLQQLQQFYQTGQSGGMPGLDTIAQMSATGMPVDQTPQWQAMVEAAQRGIGQGAEGIREQMAFTGNLAASPFGNALGDYFGQTEKDLNAQLIKAQTDALESARGRQMGAGEFLTAGAGNLGQLFQGMDQESINRTLAEFIRTRPEYGPLLNMMFGQSTTYPPVITEQYGLGGTGAALSGAGTAMGGFADLYKVLTQGGSGNTPIFQGGGGGGGGGMDESGAPQ